MQSKFQELANALWKRSPEKLTVERAMHVARRMRRMALESTRLQVKRLNDGLTPADIQRDLVLDIRFKQLCKEVGCGAVCTGDPGSSQRVVFPDGYHNTLGGPQSGYAVA